VDRSLSETPAKVSTEPRVALVTGASRGVGAATARGLARRGFDVAIVFRSKAPRAERVANEIRTMGRRALPIQADLTDRRAIEAMARRVEQTFGRLDLLILNASGGLEKDKDPGYPMQVNLTAQLDTVEALLPSMPSGSSIVFVTSHWAHFHGERPVPLPAYEPVAASKRAGETALRERLPELTRRGVGLRVVSGDAIEGTITPKLLERLDPSYRAARRESQRDLPTVEEFAATIVDVACDSSLPTGHTTFVGPIE
jgi:3-oxoacyl-[acyl-carrier protein] reductase